MPQIDTLLKSAVTQRASDLHLSAGEPVRMRIDGDLVEVTKESLTAAQVHEVICEILSEDEIKKLETNKNLDKSHSVEGTGNFRVNVFYTRRGVAAVMRTIPSKIPSFDTLGLPPSLKGLADLGKGLVLVTGPTGSGKSTTLAAIINHINVNYKYHILTVEDPVEFVHQSQQSLINQREIGSHCATFADALKYALREDPDVILVGEMRDLETIALAITAAETGHLVFGTLHTRGAGASVDRIIDSFPSGQQAMIRAMLSESLAAVVSQSLLKRADGKGRIAAYEVLIATHAISNLIREGKTFQIRSAIQTGKKDGMILMDQHIYEMVAEGIVTAQEAMPYMEDSSMLKNFKPSRPSHTTESASTSPPARPEPPKLAAQVSPPKLDGLSEPRMTEEIKVEDNFDLESAGAQPTKPAVSAPKPMELEARGTKMPPIAEPTKISSAPPSLSDSIAATKAASAAAKNPPPPPAKLPPKADPLNEVPPPAQLSEPKPVAAPRGLEMLNQMEDPLEDDALEDDGPTLAAGEIGLDMFKAPTAPAGHGGKLGNLENRPVAEEIFEENSLPERDETATFEIPPLKAAEPEFKQSPPPVVKAAPPPAAPSGKKLPPPPPLPQRKVG